MMKDIKLGLEIYLKESLILKNGIFINFAKAEYPAKTGNIVVFEEKCLFMKQE